MARGNPQINFRAPEEWLAPVRERLEHEDQPESSVIRRDVARYYAVLRMELARGLPFSAAEIALICDALNGYAFLEGEDYEFSLRAWWAEIADGIRLNRLDRKWNVTDRAGLVERCRNLSPGASAALLDAVQRWWIREGEEGESIEDSLRAVGLWPASSDA